MCPSWLQKSLYLDNRYHFSSLTKNLSDNFHFGPELFFLAAISSIARQRNYGYVSSLCNFFAQKYSILYSKASYRQALDFSENRINEFGLNWTLRSQTGNSYLNNTLYCRARSILICV